MHSRCTCAAAVTVLQAAPRRRPATAARGRHRPQIRCRLADSEAVVGETLKVQGAAPWVTVTVRCPTDTVPTCELINTFAAML